MDNSTYVSISLAPTHYDLALITQESLLRKGGKSIVSYILFFCLLLCVEATWSKLRTKQSLSQRMGPYKKAIWYSHKEPVLGLDVLWICAKAVYHHKFLEATARIVLSYGRTLSYLYVGKQAILTIDPENLKAMLSERFHDFGLGNTRKLSLRPLFGGGIFNSDGSTWKHHRSVLRPFLSRVRAAELDVFETHVQHLIATVPNDGSTIDIQRSFSSFTLDISTELFLGTSTNLLSASESVHAEGQQFAAAFDYAQRAVSGIDDFSLFSLVTKWLLGDRRLKESVKYIHGFVDQVLERAIDSSAAPPKQDPTWQQGEKIFFHTLLGEGRAREDIKYDILNIILAGKDTMAAFLSSIWYVLSQRPDVYEKIRDEISVLDGRRPTKEDLNRFPYLRMVLQEVLRLYPPVAANQRTAEIDTILPHGGGRDGQSPIRVPRGTSVGYSVYAMHRIPEFFGQDVDIFRPERWVDIRPTWAFMPFHAGPRTCLGQQLALALAKYSTIRLIQHFACVEDRNERPWEEKLGLNCSSRHGVKVGLIAKCQDR